MSEPPASLPEPADVETLAVGPEEMRFIRSLRVHWWWADAGAPRMTLLSPGASSAEVIGRVREATGPWLVADTATLTAVYRRGMQAATAFVLHAELSPGRYEFESPLVPSQLDQQPFAASARVQIDGGTIRMDVTAEHLALLRGAQVRLFDDDGIRCEAGIDPKRPYGETAFFYADMARLLALEPEGPPDDGGRQRRAWTEDQLAWLHDLHVTTQPALQVLLRFGTLGTDRFYRDRARHGPWAAVPAPPLG